MKIEIGKYTITSDPLNLIVNEKRIAKEGKNKDQEYLVPVAYFANIAAIASYLVETKIKKSEAQSIAELLEEVKAAKAEVAATIQKVWDKE